MAYDLTVTYAFGPYLIGDKIRDPTVVAGILASTNQAFVTRTAHDGPASSGPPSVASYPDATPVTLRIDGTIYPFTLAGLRTYLGIDGAPVTTTPATAPGTISSDFSDPNTILPRV